MVGIGIVAVYIVLLLLSRKEQVEWSSEKSLRPFYRMALYLGKKGLIKRLFIKNNSQAYRDLTVLYPNISSEGIIQEFSVKKIGLCLAVIFVAVLVGSIVSFEASTKIVLTEFGQVPRETDGVSVKEITLQGSLENGDYQTFSVRVEPQILMGEKLKEAQEQFRGKLPRLILAGNKSLSQVSSNLLLSDSYEGFPFAVCWKSERPDLISTWGTVRETHAPERVVLTAEISYQDACWEEDIEVVVISGESAASRDANLELQTFLLSSEELSRQDEVWSLPRKYGDDVIAWKQQVADNGPLFCVLGVAVAVLIFFLSDYDLHNRLLKRQTLMKQEYVDIVSSLALYMAAGMTIRGSMFRMCEDRSEKKTPIFEEMQRACRELQSGIPEIIVYESFGKRTGLQEYIRLSALLSQNLKKGNSTLLERLREEIQRASLEKLQSMKRLGEEAGTKLLVPTTILLAVVMIIIMIPAFSSISM